MPIYNFVNTKTQEEWEDMMTMSEKDQFLKENEHVQQLPPSKLNIVSGVAGITHKNDAGWGEVLSKVAEAHPASALADQHLPRSGKEAKTRQAVEKWKKRITGKSN